MSFTWKWPTWSTILFVTVSVQFLYILWHKKMTCSFIPQWDSSTGEIQLSWSRMIDATHLCISLYCQLKTVLSKNNGLIDYQIAALMFGFNVKLSNSSFVLTWLSSNPLISKTKCVSIKLSSLKVELTEFYHMFTLLLILVWPLTTWRYW